MSTSKASISSEKDRKKIDWFVVTLYAIVFIGIGLVAWALIALMTPTIPGGQ